MRSCCVAGNDQQQIGVAAADLLAGVGDGIGDSYGATAARGTNTGDMACIIRDSVMSPFFA